MTAPITWVNTTTRIQTSLFPARNIESSGTLTISTIAQIQTTIAASQISRSGPKSRNGARMTVDPPVDRRARSLAPVGDLRSAAERRRAIKAIALGSVLGLFLAALAATRRRTA